MADMNSINLTGRITRDGEMRYTGNNTAILRFGIAVNRWDGKQNQASFFDCTIFGKYAESMQRFTEKGKRVGISGEARQERWEKDGIKHEKVSIVVNQLILLDGAKNDGTQAQGQPQEHAQDDEVPFL